MKTLFQEDLIEAGYELPTSGLCFNLNPEDSKALISEGEWLLAEDELVAKEGEEQQYLYLVVSGTVELSKRDEKGKQQSIANLTTGETFGEVAFLRGHIASATSETRGLCILWRVTHNQLLDFIGSHGSIAGQLCLNLAGLLADRLLKENKLVSKVRMDLDDAISTLREANDEDTVKTAALKELQIKVDNLNQATRVRRNSLSKQSKFNSISMASLAVACIAVLAMVGLYSSYDHDAPGQVEALSGELESMKKNETFYLQLKKNIEAENEQLVLENSNFKQLGDSLAEELKSVKEQLSFRDYEYDSLKAKLLETEDELASLISIEQEAQKADELVTVQPSELYIPLVPQSFLDKVKEWTTENSTLAFPCEVKVVNETVTLSDLELTASIEVSVGGVLVATRFHPVSEEYIVARQGTSDTFMASVHINNTDIMEVLAKKYVDHQNSMGQKVENLFLSKRFSQLDKNFSEEEE
jgi:CRP-like cAMP-binding protein